MGFWSGLGKGLLAAGGAIAAPFTGGASLAATLPAIIGGAGAVASGISEGRAQGRQAEAATTMQHDLGRQQAERQRMRSLLAADLFGDKVSPDLIHQLRTQPPGMTPLPQAGKMDSFLNVLGGVGQFGGVLGEALKPKPPINTAQQPVATMGQFFPQKPWQQVRF